MCSITLLGPGKLPHIIIIVRFVSIADFKPSYPVWSQHKYLWSSCACFRHLQNEIGATSGLTYTGDEGRRKLRFSRAVDRLHTA